jgi:hypothetical protein
VFTFQKANNQSSRRQINIKGVNEGVLILPGNQYRVVLEVSSVNFELKSEEEQDGLINTYQSFLNSLSTPLQVIIRIREVDMDKYLGDLREKLAGETEEIYRTQLQNYTGFVKKLVTNNKILSRHFYVVLPFDAKPRTDFNLAKEQLALSADIVSKGLSRLGVSTRQLDSLEILNLFYSFYSPKRAKEQPITDSTLSFMNNQSYVEKAGVAS